MLLSRTLWSRGILDASKNCVKSPFRHRLKSELLFHVAMPRMDGPRCCCSFGRHSSVPRSESRVVVDESAYVGSLSTLSHSSGGTSHASRAALVRASHPCMHTSPFVTVGLRVLHIAYAAWPAQSCISYSSLTVCRILLVTGPFSSPDASAFMHVAIPASSSAASAVTAIRTRSTIARL